ncbi:N(4)-(beta-N-acetylglucosaminyl)-L-asparaginase [Caldilinea sp.]|uniref:Putative L-asparaginase n=1 Tax=Caldilinea aerophila (strain DSM 14535 / JCM 11387 / NBRC 104270 / STL-6-O1) TaxID=926550 RepID=I0I9M0_CALAS|nr:N(4)-(beta-N-acetylglucosaminyl)-L-asparaginase [Caldilinea sp.]BAM01958.1 putative L-asparaginase [Caldilinea aerophila DSM 14535 = NBRC 104270]
MRVPVPVIVASENGRRGILAAMPLLRAGGSALDAVELACRVIEDDPDDHSVGYGGLPNALGEVELDASIMDGATLRAGAVAAVQGYGRAITLARRVMEETPHVLLAARGAERLAAELGEQPQDQRTEEALRRWRERFIERGLTPGATENLRMVARMLTQPLNLQDKLYQASRLDTLGTVNFLALDAQGNLASAVSTSGLGWKYPGRVGDSPLIGAGNYCDNRYGAAACTGMGELAIRVSTARSLVLYLKCGMSLIEAGHEALRDLLALDTGPGQYMNIVALTPTGEHAGFTTVPEKYYLFQRADMDEPQSAQRLMVG